MKDLTYLVGKTFGYWTVLPHQNNGYGKVWCKCCCDKEKFVVYSLLENGRSKSCGCHSSDCIMQK